MVIVTCLNLIRLYAVVSSPIIPFTAKHILKSLSLKDDITFNDATDLRTLKSGHKFSDIPPLFKKIEDTDVLKYKEQFGAEE